MKTQSGGPVRRFLRRTRDLAPIVSIGLLLLLPLGLRTEVVQSEAVLARHAEIRAAIDEVPWIINGWTGEAVPVPAAATEILQPNAILSRRYRKMGEGTEVTVVVVHCADIRDMMGHFPPVCYPNAGWALVASEARRMGSPASPVGTTDLACYTFERSKSGSSDLVRLRVFNFVVLPDGAVATDLAGLQRLASRTATTALGVAQVQLVVSSRVSDDDVATAFEDLLSGMDGLFDLLREGMVRE